MISGDTEKTPNEGVTAGSQSIENSGTALRLAGAQVRAILLELAAKRLGADAAALSVADGVVAAPDGRKLSYGGACRRGRSASRGNGEGAAEAASAHRIVGQPIARRDIPAKVTGGAAYVQDLRLPGMLHGRIVRPPRYGAKLEGFDAVRIEATADGVPVERDGSFLGMMAEREMLHSRSVRLPGDRAKLEGFEARVKAMPGVVAVVRDGSFLGVIAEREEQAIKASLALAESARWTAGPPLPGPGTHLRSPAGAADRGQGRQREAGGACRGREIRRGDLSQALHGACLDRAVLRGRPVRATAR